MHLFHLLPLALLASLGAARPADSHSSVVRDSELFKRDALQSCIGKLQKQHECTNATASPFMCCPPMQCGSDKLCR